MFDWVSSILGIAKQYEFLLGLLGVSAIGAIALFLKKIASSFINLFKKTCTSSLEIISTDFNAYKAINGYIDSKKKSSFTNSFKLMDGVSDETPWILTFGEGHHILIYKKRPILISHKTELRSGGFNPVSIFKITKFGIDIKLFTDLINEATDLIINNTEMLNIYTWRSDYWRQIEQKPKRKIESVFLNKEKKERIDNDITNFLLEKTKEKYQKIGAPHRRGYLLYGNPGTGKSSLIHALASKHNLPIFYLNLKDIGSDYSLVDAFQKVRKRSIILIEDVDLSKLERRNLNKKQQTQDYENENKTADGITLSCLLNVIDGIIATNNRILFMTTNKLESIDPALIRQGRIDYVEEIKYLEKEEIQEMFKYYFNDHIEINKNISIIGCELQNKMLSTINESDERAKDIIRQFILNYETKI